MRFSPRTRPGERISNWSQFSGRRGVIATNAASDTIAGGSRTIVFNSSGTLTVYDEPISVEYLVVGAGGAGVLGGGGAGGYATNVGGTLLTLPVGAHTITVGSGVANANGEPSSLGQFVVCAGGGRGGSSSADNTSAAGRGGASGGGGGGGVAAIAVTNASGYALGSLGTGNNGGTGRTNSSGSTGSPGGGGGSGGVGAPSSSGGAGGAGTANSITGTSVTYAAGGAGGSTASAGAANTGNGGTAAIGGSGIVVIKYTI